MKKILLPTDFSENAFNAIEYALHLFKHDQCIFYLLNTYTPLFYRIDYFIGGPAVSTVPDVGVDISLEGLKLTLERIKSKYQNPKHEFESISVFNTLNDQVRETCDKENIDMVVMGTQGASGAKEFFLGSNTVHVIRNATVPILAVPEGYKFKTIERVLLPTDYASKYHLEELKPLQDLVQKFNAALHVVHAVEVDEMTGVQLLHKEYLKILLKDTSVDFEDVTEQYMPNIVHDYAEKNKVDLIVMLNRKHSFLDRLLLKQNVDAVGYHSRVPFLVLRDTSEIIT